MFIPFNIKRRIKWFLYKSFSLLSIIRGYNLLIIILAQYLTSIFILSEKASTEVISDFNLFCIVLSSVITIASGYIINNFYDSEKDLINRPHKSKLDRLVSQQKKLTIYFIFNFTAVIIVSYVSFRAVVFFSVYIFCIWLYSHKLKRITFIGNLSATALAILPFFAIFIYYKNYDSVVFIHAIFLMLILFMRELVKDLENIKGDLANNYNTIPIVYGEKISKKILFIISTICISTSIFLISKCDIGKMTYFFWFVLSVLIIFDILLYSALTKKQYIILHNLLKLIIVIGVFSISMIKPSIFVKIF